MAILPFAHDPVLNTWERSLTDKLRLITLDLRYDDENYLTFQPQPRAAARQELIDGMENISNDPESLAKWVKDTLGMDVTIDSDFEYIEGPLDHSNEERRWINDVQYDEVLDLYTVPRGQRDSQDDYLHLTLHSGRDEDIYCTATFSTETARSFFSLCIDRIDRTIKDGENWRGSHSSGDSPGLHNVLYVTSFVHEDVAYVDVRMFNMITNGSLVFRAEHILNYIKSLLSAVNLLELDQ